MTSSDEQSQLRCPACGEMTLKPIVRSGVEIDVCRRCNGLWLDRGELDKLIRADAGPASVDRFAAPIPADRYDPDRVADEGQPGKGERRDGEHRRDGKRKKEDRDDDRRRESGRSKKKKRKKSWGRRLGDIVEELIDELD